jgi:integrase
VLAGNKTESLGDAMKRKKQTIKRGRRIPTRFPGVYEYIPESGEKPDVTFYICYRFDGRLIWERAGKESEGYSAALADQVRGERIRNIRHGEELPKKKRSPLFKDAMDGYLKWAKNKRSYVSDESRYKLYLKDRFDNKRLSEITALDLERLKGDLTKKKLSPATIKHALCVFRQAVNRSIEWGLYKGENPMKRVKMPVINNQRQRFLSHDEAEALLIKLRAVSEQVHDMALLSLHCGLRAGEIFNLCNQDIDLKNGLIRISDPKNKESRSAYMTTAVKDVLKGYNDPEKPAENIFRDRWHDEQVKYLSKTFDRAVTELKYNNGITDRRNRVTFHTLRHTFASWLALQGESLITIRDLLGHKTTTMTNRYAHLMPEHNRAAVHRLEKAFHYKLNENNIKSIHGQ